jgi:hypothetical protein
LPALGEADGAAVQMPGDVQKIVGLRAGKAAAMDEIGDAAEQRMVFFSEGL